MFAWGESLRKKRDQHLPFDHRYPRLVRRLLREHPLDEAMSLAVGGEFNAIGILERDLLIHLGLPKNGYLIDVGCGSGRLVKPLLEYLSGRYLGLDIVPELIEYASNSVSRPEWRFEVCEGVRIPEQDGMADMVCFFSVFTHILHEHSYVYLQEAKRVLKSGGKIIFSFLDFAIPAHWSVFEASIRDLNEGAYQLNVFIGKDVIRAWASHLDLKVEQIRDATEPFIPLPNPITLTNGSVLKDIAGFGQSICVLSR
jgi:SAM-dependent methyltransferase